MAAILTVLTLCFAFVFVAAVVAGFVQALRLRQRPCRCPDVQVESSWSRSHWLIRCPACLTVWAGPFDSEGMARLNLYEVQQAVNVGSEHL